jgi:outer membrane protein assembly factor BamB
MIVIRKKLLTLVFVAIQVVGFGCGCRPEKDGNNWPRWRGSNFNGIASQGDLFNFSNGRGLKIVWKKLLGSGYSSVSLADDQAVTMFSDSTFDYLIALDMNDGSEKWRYKIDSTYFGHDGSHNGPISTPTIDGNNVFGLGPKGALFRLNFLNGEEVWRQQLTKDHAAIVPLYGFGTSPAIVGDILIVQTGGTKGNGISGLDKNTGKTLWTAAPDTVFSDSPIIAELAGVKQVVSVGAQYVYGLNPLTGEQLWQYKHNSTNDAMNPTKVGADKIFLHYFYDESLMLQVNNKNGTLTISEVWKSKQFKTYFNPALFYQGYLYGYSGEFLTCVDANNGNLVWKSRPPGDGLLILVDGHLVIQGQKGMLHVAKASHEGYQEVARLKVLEGGSWTPPSFANNKIFVRGLSEIANVGIGAVQ